MLPCASGQAVVDVVVEPPTVAIVEFDSRAPPPDMPRVGLEGAAVCRNEFELEVSIESALDELGPHTVRAYPAEFEITTRLKVTIFMPRGSSAKVRAHEEGHRLIGEHYYRNAEAAARAAARAVSSRSFDANGRNRAEAERAVGDAVLAALQSEYMRRTHVRSAAANARYDEITDHGRSPIVEADAIAAAIAADP